MENVFVLTYEWDVENSGQDMECCNVYLKIDDAHKEMEIAYYAKLDELHANRIKDSVNNYLKEKEAYISNEDSAEFWMWRIDEKTVN